MSLHFGSILRHTQSFNLYCHRNAAVNLAQRASTRINLQQQRNQILLPFLGTACSANSGGILECTL